MNPQQRIAAIGTDKELSDLLDFSAVRLSVIILPLLQLLSLIQSLTCNICIIKVEVLLFYVVNICLFFSQLYDKQHIHVHAFLYILEYVIKHALVLFYLCFAHVFLYLLNTRQCLCNVSTAVFQKKNVFVSSNRCFLHL